MKRTFIGHCLLATAAGVIGCSTAATPGSSAPGATPTPTPRLLSRLDPNVVEETETYVIHRLPKSDYLRVDERHVRHPLIAKPVEFFKEDEKYYYIHTQRWTPEEAAIRQAARQAAEAQRPTPTPGPAPSASTEYPKPSPADFEDLLPRRAAAGRLKLQKVPSPGLSSGGMWRASFVLHDVNGDGLTDVVAPPPRLGGAAPHIWLGKGTGTFSEWPLTFTENGVPSAAFGTGYGGISAGDIDGDGKADLVTASHGYGLSAQLGDGTGTFRVVEKGLPKKEFSSQAIALLDADGDGKLDIVASRDILVQDADAGPNLRLYLYRGAAGWEAKPDALVRGIISNSLHPWDFDGDGRKDLLTGSHQFATVPLLWRNEGKGAFSPVKFDQMEVYAFHLATVPGTFGPRRVPAFADAYHLYTNEPQSSRAIGINIYSFEGGAWKRHRVWRKKEGKSFQYALAFGDLDGDGLDDVAFADTEAKRLRVFFQGPAGSFEELAEKDEPVLDSPGQCVRIGDLDRDGRPDLVVSKTVSSTSPSDPGGWDVYLNKP